MTGREVAPGEKLLEQALEPLREQARERARAEAIRYKRAGARWAEEHADEANGPRPDPELDSLFRSFVDRMPMSSARAVGRAPEFRGWILPLGCDYEIGGDYKDTTPLTRSRRLAVSTLASPYLVNCSGGMLTKSGSVSASSPVALDAGFLRRSILRDLRLHGIAQHGNRWPGLRDRELREGVLDTSEDKAVLPRIVAEAMAQLMNELGLVRVPGGSR